MGLPLSGPWDPPFPLFLIYAGCPRIMLLEAPLLLCSPWQCHDYQCLDTYMLSTPGADSVWLHVCHRSAICHSSRDSNTICHHGKSYWPWCSWYWIYSSSSFHSTLIRTLLPRSSAQEATSDYNDNICHYLSPSSFKTLLHSPFSTANVSMMISLLGTEFPPKIYLDWKIPKRFLLPYSE